MKRVFIAINLPKRVRKKLAKVQEDIRVNFEVDPVKWVSEDNLHITLAFLGVVEESTLKALKNKMEDFNFSKFKILLDDVKYVPSRDKAKMIWTTGESRELILLKKDVDTILNKVSGLENNSDEFIPHVTLGRVQKLKFKRQPLEEIPLLEDVFVDLKFKVESVDIMESKLRKGGPTYTKIKSINLN